MQKKPDTRNERLTSGKIYEKVKKKHNARTREYSKKTKKKYITN